MPRTLQTIIAEVINTSAHHNNLHVVIFLSYSNPKRIHLSRVSGRNLRMTIVSFFNKNSSFRTTTYRLSDNNFQSTLRKRREQNISSQLAKLEHWRGVQPLS